jgi:hypothetical protein
MEFRSTSAASYRIQQEIDRRQPVGEWLERANPVIAKVLTRTFMILSTLQNIVQLGDPSSTVADTSPHNYTEYCVAM